MENWKKRLFKVLIYAGIEKQDYQDIKEDIREKNSELLMLGTGISIAYFGILWIASYFGRALETSRLLYATVFFALIAVFGLRYTVKGVKKKAVLPNCYLVLVFLYAFAILQSVLAQPEMPAVSFHVLLFITAFLVIDRPYRIILLQIIMTVVFCVTSYYFKRPEIAAIDTANAVSSLLLGTICSVYLSGTRFRGIIYNRNTRRELDTDGLTKLMIKKAVERDIRRYISETKEAGALIMIDLDNFKQVNDTKGHAYGDVILKLTGESISSSFRASDIKGRFGGDEFIVFLPGMKDRKLITERLDHFKELMEKGVTGEENQNGVHQSIGIAMYPEDAETYEDLFEKADKALYAAKKGGKNKYCFYTSVKIHSGN